MHLLNMTIGQYLRRASTQWPNNIAVIQSNTGASMTWAELDAVSDSYAKGFQKLGLGKGDKVLLWMGNRIEWCISFLAAEKIGAIVCGVNIRLKNEEIRYIFKTSNARAIIFSDGFRDISYKEIIRSIFFNRNASADPVCAPEILIHVGPEPCDLAIEFAAIPYLDDLENIEIQMAGRIDPNDVANISFTSGTTKNPKGVMLTHYNIVNTGFFTGIGLDISESDRLCLPVPFFHCFGLTVGILLCIGFGTSMVLVEAYGEEDVLAAVHKYRCTALHGVPTMFQRLLEYERLGDYDVSSLRTGIIAGAACSEKVLRGVTEQLGMTDVVVAYGQTETSPGCTQTCLSDSLQTKICTVGKPLPFVEMRVVDLETGAACAAGKRGELCSRGYHVMKGYYNSPEETAAAIDDNGWYHTGDIGFVDDDGYYHFEGRLKEIIVRGGENISPSEIEAAILSHEGVRDAKVYGVPVDIYGEEIAASICLNDGYSLTADDVRSYLKYRMADYKIPKFIDFCKSFEVNSSGKIVISILRERIKRNIIYNNSPVEKSQTTKSAQLAS